MFSPTLLSKILLKPTDLKIDKLYHKYYKYRFYRIVPLVQQGAKSALSTGSFVVHVVFHGSYFHNNNIDRDI
jgi:hypothetical protein